MGIYLVCSREGGEAVETCTGPEVGDVLQQAGGEGVGRSGNLLLHDDLHCKTREGQGTWHCDRRVVHVLWFGSCLQSSDRI